MKLTNQEIYTYALNLNNAFDDGTQKLPVKINFYLQKNKNILTTLAQDIENARMEIVKAYGTLSEDETQYIVPREKVVEAQQELMDLSNLEQEVNIYTISFDSLSEDLTLTTSQMEAIMFMID